MPAKPGGCSRSVWPAAWPRAAVGVPIAALLLACTACTASTSDAAPLGPCLTLYPALRIEGGCTGTLRVLLNSRELPATPREVDAGGAVILPWPTWAMEGMLSTAGYDGGAQTSFSATPYTCQVVTVACP